MICPNCGADADFAVRGGYSTEPHGETFWDEWLVCGACNAPCTQAELDRENKEEDWSLNPITAKVKLPMAVDEDYTERDRRAGKVGGLA